MSRPSPDPSQLCRPSGSDLSPVTQAYRESRAMKKIEAILPKVKLEVVLADDQVDAAIEAIIGAAKTDKIGDGKIFVSTIEQAIRIRTSESGEDAL